MIIVKNNLLTYNDTSYKCAIGKNGIVKKKIEGDKCTPAGTYTLEKIYYRSDRLTLPNLNFQTIPILKNYGWCDDIKIEKYNKLIKLPFEYRHEQLFRNDNIYDIICTINYNNNPVKKNLGSAIFLHIANYNYSGTAGCIAIKKSDLINLLQKINSHTTIKIFA